MRRKKLIFAAFAAVMLAVASGVMGAAMVTHFGESTETISYVDFVSVLLTCLGVMMTTLTLFIGSLAVIGWASIEGKLRTHLIEFIGSELDEEKPLGKMVRKAVRDAVYEGVSPLSNDGSDLTLASEDEAVQ